MGVLDGQQFPIALIVSRPVDVVAVKGKARGVRVYELVPGLPGDAELAPSADDLERQKLTERAFHAYIAGDFHVARSLYEQLAKAFPDDQIGPMFMERCNAYLAEPPGADWTGVTRMTTK